jgi:hypothetical protein
MADLTVSSDIDALLSAADNAAARAALGLGTLATQSGTFSGTSSGTNTGDQTTITGNAGSATVLQTARAINGVSFDGSAAITVTAEAGTLTGATLNATVTGSSLTSVGTIGTGTWQGTIIAPAYLGTGSSITTKYLRGDGTWQTVTSGSGDLLAANNLSDVASIATARTNLKVPASDPTGITGADAITNIISLTQAEYDAIDPGDISATTYYLITDAVDAVFNETHAASHTLTPSECYGAFYTITSAATMTLPAGANGMSLTVTTRGATAGSVKAGASDFIYLDGTALDNGDKITNSSTSGDTVVLFADVDGNWTAITDGSWTDGGA